ncbi:MAG: hypothetical protein HY820_17075 [Acidobacteria bacterium]|nr:hypothetical protein [Acidobacteriota bacterium]
MPFGPGVPKGIAEGLAKDVAAMAVVLIGGGRSFLAGSKPGVRVYTVLDSGVHCGIPG